MTATFVLLAGGLFSFTEPWDWAEGSWFSFITATTVGFGDYVPSYGGGVVWIMQCTLMVVGVSMWGLLVQIIAAPDPQDETDNEKNDAPKIAVEAAGQAGFLVGSTGAKPAKKGKTEKTGKARKDHDLMGSRQSSAKKVTESRRKEKEKNRATVIIMSGKGRQLTVV
jgi:hypothetical protein